MLPDQILLGIFGFSFGLLSSAGVFTVLSSVGLIPRFAGRMHVADKVFALEEAVILGTVFGCIASVFPDCLQAGSYLLSGTLRGSYSAVVRVAGTVFLCFLRIFFGELYRMPGICPLRRCWIPFPFLQGEWVSGMVLGSP